MTESAVLDRLDKLTSAVQFMARQTGHRLTRAELCERMGIHRNTLAKRMESRTFPAPDANGRWLLSEVIEWECSQPG